MRAQAILTAALPKQKTPLSAFHLTYEQTLF
jgi:hypothetical protein